MLSVRAVVGSVLAARAVMVVVLAALRAMMVMPVMLMMTALALTIVRMTLTVLTVAVMVAMIAMTAVLAMIAMALSLGDDAGALVFLAPLAAGGAQIAMPAAAGANVLVFFHVYIESFRRSFFYLVP